MLHSDHLPVLDGASRSGVGLEVSYPNFSSTAVIQGDWACVSYVSMERDSNRKIEEGTSSCYKHELFLLGISSGGREVSGYL